MDTVREPHLPSRANPLPERSHAERTGDVSTRPVITHSSHPGKLSRHSSSFSRRHVAPATNSLFLFHWRYNDRVPCFLFSHTLDSFFYPWISYDTDRCAHVYHRESERLCPSVHAGHRVRAYTFVRAWLRSCLAACVRASVSPWVRESASPWVRESVRPCVRACVRECVRAWVRAWLRTCANLCICVFMVVYLARNPQLWCLESAGRRTDQLWAWRRGAPLLRCPSRLGGDGGERPARAFLPAVRLAGAPTIGRALPPTRPTLARGGIKFNVYSWIWINSISTAVEKKYSYTVKRSTSVAIQLTYVMVN